MGVIKVFYLLASIRILTILEADKALHEGGPLHLIERGVDRVVEVHEGAQGVELGGTVDHGAGDGVVTDA